MGRTMGEVWREKAFEMIADEVANPGEDSVEKVIKLYRATYNHFARNRDDLRKEEKELFAVFLRPLGFVLPIANDDLTEEEEIASTFMADKVILEVEKSRPGWSSLKTYTGGEFCHGINYDSPFR